MDTLFLLAQESNLIRQEIGFVILLSIAALVAIVIRRIRLPYTVALVLAGLVLSFFPNFLNVTISSDLILAILVPPLLFEATLHIKWESLRFDLAPVLLLAFLGTFTGTVLVGVIISELINIPIMAALAFGALISATDPVAVVAFFRSLGVSKRLGILVEGESLFNDGVAIVLFNLALGLAAGGAINQIPDVSLSEIVGEFVRVALGGLTMGTLLGYLVSYVILKNVDDHLIETATTVALAYGAYVLAEEIHVSGILAVVTAGLMVGNIGTLNTSPTTRITLENFWEFLAYAVNSLVFLLIGLEIEISGFWPFIVPVLVAVVVVLVIRLLIVYSIGLIYNRIVPTVHDIPINYLHTMFWGGLRGAISLALALTLTGDIFDPVLAKELQVMTFGVVLFTLLVQGTTIGRLIRFFGLSDKPPQQIEQQRLQAELYVKRAGKRELDRLREEGILSPDIWEAMAHVYDEKIEEARQELRTHLRNYSELEQEVFLQARADVLRAERTALSDAARRGFIAEEVYEELIEEADKRTEALALIRERRSFGKEYRKGQADGRE